MVSVFNITKIKVRGGIPSLLLIILFLIPSIRAEAAYCGFKLQTYQATAANGADNTSFYNLILYWYQYPSAKTNCNDDQVYFSYSDFDAYLTLKSNFSLAQTDITNLKSDNATNKADISSLKADNITNKNDIASLLVDVNNLKSSSSSTQPDAVYDYVNAAQFWALAFSSVITLWLVARMSGTIIDAVRRF